MSAHPGTQQLVSWLEGGTFLKWEGHKCFSQWHPRSSHRFISIYNEEQGVEQKDHHTHWIE